MWWLCQAWWAVVTCALGYCWHKELIQKARWTHPSVICASHLGQLWYKGHTFFLSHWLKDPHSIRAICCPCVFIGKRAAYRSRKRNLSKAGRSGDRIAMTMKGRMKVSKGLQAGWPFEVVIPPCHLQSVHSPCAARLRTYLTVCYDVYDFGLGWIHSCHRAGEIWGLHIGHTWTKQPFVSSLTAWPCPAPLSLWSVAKLWTPESGVREATLRISSSKAKSTLCHSQVLLHLPTALTTVCFQEALCVRSSFHWRERLRIIPSEPFIFWWVQ